MAGSQDAPELEADGEAADKVPHWLDKCGAFDHSDMMYTKGQQQADNERRAKAKAAEDSAVRAFRADAAKAPAPSVVVAPRVKNKVDEGPAPVLKRRRVDAPAPAPAPAPLSGLVAYGSSDSDSTTSRPSLLRTCCARSSLHAWRRAKLRRGRHLAREPHRLAPTEVPGACAR